MARPLLLVAVSIGCGGGGDDTIHIPPPDTSTPDTSASDTVVPMDPPPWGEGHSCHKNVHCNAPLVCNWAEGSVCAPPQQFGDDCEHETDCLEELTCPLELGESHTCECEPCAEGLVCGSPGCVEPGSAALGERCGHNVSCAGDRVCLYVEKPYVCGPAVEIGGLCGHPTDCVEGLTCHETCLQACDPESSDAPPCPEGEVCVAVQFLPTIWACDTPLDAGEQCFHAASCAEGLACVGLQCSAPVPLGDACPTGQECAPEHVCEKDTLTCVEPTD